MANFMYLFRRNPAAFQALSPEQMEQSLKRWIAWRDSLEKDGHRPRQGERLEDTGKVVRGKAKQITDGPFAEVKDTIGGILLIEAKDLAEAVRLAEGCPVLNIEGSVEVRPILSM